MLGKFRLSITKQVGAPARAETTILESTIKRNNDPAKFLSHKGFRQITLQRPWPRIERSNCKNHAGSLFLWIFIPSVNALAAQPDTATASKTVGRVFESLRDHHNHSAAGSNA
jgi:hypothetical protein